MYHSYSILGSFPSNMTLFGNTWQYVKTPNVYQFSNKYLLHSYFDLSSIRNSKVFNFQEVAQFSSKELESKHKILLRAYMVPILKALTVS